MKTPEHYESEIMKFKLCECTTMKEIVLVQKHYRYIREELRAELKCIKLDMLDEKDSIEPIKSFFRVIGGARAERNINRSTKHYQRKDARARRAPYEELLKKIEIKLLAGDRMKLKLIS